MYIEKIRLFQNPAATLRICELLAELLEPWITTQWLALPMEA